MANGAEEESINTQMGTSFKGSGKMMRSFMEFTNLEKEIVFRENSNSTKLAMEQ